MSKKKILQYQQEYEEIIRIDGNTVRKLSAMPEQEEEYQARPRRQVAKEPAKRVGFGTMLLSAVFVLVCLLVCVEYLNIHSENTRVRSSITELEGKLETITAQNDSLDYSINSYVDIDRIIDIATKELGMIRITKDQINIYDSSEFEYMEKYADIPME